MLESKKNVFTEKILDIMAEYVEDIEYNVPPPKEQIVFLVGDICRGESQSKISEEAKTALQACAYQLAAFLKVAGTIAFKDEDVLMKNEALKMAKDILGNDLQL